MSRPTPIIRPRNKVPIARTKVSYFDPTWTTTDNWDDFGVRHETGWRPASRTVIRRQVTPVVHREVVPITYTSRREVAPVVTETRQSSMMSSSLRDMEREMDRLWNENQHSCELPCSFISSQLSSVHYNFSLYLSCLAMN